MSNHNVDPNPFSSAQSSPSFGARVAGLVALLLVSAFPSHAVDDDQKSYTGSGCQAAYASHADRLVYGTNGAVRNVSNVSAYIVCPVIVDEFDWLGIRSDGWESMYIRAEDNHLTQDISCTLNEIDFWGAVSASFVARTQSLGGVMLFSSHSGASDRPKPSAYALRCVLPPRSSQGVSALHYYRFTEE